MAFIIDASDAEFAVATGSNVNDGPGTSTFDYPPKSSSGLVITANPKDPSPHVFSVGDTYDLVYGNGGGGKGGTFEDAVVIRSDALPQGGHAVVLEGVNEDGNVEHIVWTPEFDLESWYFDNFEKGASPGFYTTDQDATTQYETGFVCFSSESALTTMRGEVQAGELNVGDMVLTLDRGYQPIIWVGRRKVLLGPMSASHRPVALEPKSIKQYGLRRRVIVSPNHRVLLRYPDAREALAPAKAFVGLPGVRYMWGRKEIEYISILLERHEVLDMSGLAVESFFPGRQASLLLSKRENSEVHAAIQRSAAVGSANEMEPARKCLGGSLGERAIRSGALPVLFPTQCSEGMHAAHLNSAF